MSIELLKHDNLGDKESLWFMLKNVPWNDGSLNTAEIKKYCADSDIRYALSLSGMLAMLSAIGMLTINDDRVSINVDSLGNKINDIKTKHELCQFVIPKLFKHLEDEGVLSSFISQINIYYDHHSDSYRVKNNLIELRFSAIKNLFIQLDFFKLHDTNLNILIPNEQWQEWFQENVIPKVRQETLDIVTDSKLTIEGLRRLIKSREELGRLAEEYVLRYERDRLEGHQESYRIKTISDKVVTAGFDIVSFDSTESSELDRFIEVKSFEDNIRFFWSRNEVSVSKLKGKRYYLYLVNRLLMEEDGYEPIVIQDPYRVVLEDSAWHKVPDGWIITASSK